MARDTRPIEQLQAFVLAEAGAPATPELAQALDELATGPDLAAAMAAYRSALDATVAGAGHDLDDALTRVAAGPVAFLGPAVTEPLVEQARALGIDLDGGVDLGPAGLTLTAPSATVRPDPAVLADTARAALGHLPINGLTTALELGPVHASGAGYLDPVRGHAGALLRADLGPACVDVAVLLDTRGGLAVLALLRAEFRPTGIQLGFGFSLDAVGGIVGINRSVDGEAMRDRIADGSALDALFGGGTAPDQIRATLDALQQVFPARQGSHVVGPTLRLGWLTVMGASLARLDIGIILVVPSGRVLLPGRIVVEVPGPGVPLVHLRLDVLGEVDVAGRRLSLDAALVDSKVLGALSVTGTAAARMSWGEPSVVLATVGGFYPGFHHEPVVIPPQRRIGIALANPIPAGLRISLEGYVATAAGTLQAGASASVALEVLETGISGSAGFDAIVQLAPLWFEARVFGRVSLRAFGRRLLGVDLLGTLTGPGPLVLTVTATGEILCFDVGGTRSFTLAAGAGADRQPFDGLGEVVRRHLDDPANVSGDGGGGDHDVVLAPRPPSGAPLLPPGAAMVWAQQAFPLDGPLYKAAGRVLRHPSSVSVTTTAGATAPVTRRLTTAAYTNISGADALNVPPFDDRAAGWRVAPTRTRAPSSHTVATGHRTVRLPVTDPDDRRWRLFAGPGLPLAVHAAVRALDAPAALSAGAGPAVVVQAEAWAVARPTGTTSTHRSGAAAHAHASVQAGARALPADAAAAVALP